MSAKGGKNAKNAGKKGGKKSRAMVGDLTGTATRAKADTNPGKKSGKKAGKKSSAKAAKAARQKLPKKKCCVSKPRCRRCPIRMLAEGTLPDGYTVRKRRLVRVDPPASASVGVPDAA